MKAYYIYAVNGTSPVVFRNKLSHGKISLDYSIEYFTDTQILFGNPRFNPVLNRVILTTKIAILKNKASSQLVTLNQILSILKEQFKLESKEKEIL